MRSGVRGQGLLLTQKVCPDWKDAREIVAMLRLFNYNIEDTTSAHMAINDDGKPHPLPHPCHTHCAFVVPRSAGLF